MRIVEALTLEMFIRVRQFGLKHASRVPADSAGAELLNVLDGAIEKMEELRKEVDEIWSVFRNDVEKAGVGSGVIRATHYEGSSAIRKGKGFGFVYVRGDGGTWHLLEDAKTE